MPRGKALSIAIDRGLLAEIGYGRAGKPTRNLVPAPESWASDNTGRLTQDMDGARKLLDEAGWVPGSDGIREKDGKRLKLVFQTSVNAVRQDFQALIKQWWQEIGVETELKIIDGPVFFGSDAGSPDTMQRFYADIEMYANFFEGNNAEPYLAKNTCDKAPGPDNQWQGENTSRYCDPEYDKLVDQLGAIVDPAERGAMGKRMNDMATKDSDAIIPLIYRGTARPSQQPWRRPAERLGYRAVERGRLASCETMTRRAGSPAGPARFSLTSEKDCHDPWTDRLGAGAGRPALDRPDRARPCRTRRGWRELRVLYWQAPTVLNPYLSTGAGDVDPASMVIELLGAGRPGWQPDPGFKAETPASKNGGIAADYSAVVTWKLKPGLVWSDGSPVTAEDVNSPPNIAWTRPWLRGSCKNSRALPRSRCWMRRPCG